MKRLVIFLLLVAVGTSTAVQAQYRQDKKANQFMMKLEAGAMPFVSNTNVVPGVAPIVNNHQMVGSFFMSMGCNLLRGFFMGMGAGYNYFTAPAANATGLHSGTVYTDLDFRPFETKYAPLISAKLGANYLMGTPDGNSLKPYLEFCAGINIYTRFRFINHERDNYTSWYFQAGVTHTQQTFFIPARIGLRF